MFSFHENDDNLIQMFFYGAGVNTCAPMNESMYHDQAI